MFVHSSSGLMISNPQDIAIEFINYFTNIFITSVPSQDYNFDHEGTMTNDFLNSIPSVDECLQILKSMKPNAAPGLDGLNVAFYRASWLGSRRTCTSWWLISIHPVTSLDPLTLPNLFLSQRRCMPPRLHNTDQLALLI